MGSGSLRLLEVELAYESMHPSSPFRQRVEEVLPQVLKPLRYCEFRNAEFGERNISVCAIFACAEVLEMAFCYQHTKMILHELQSEGAADVS